MLGSIINFFLSFRGFFHRLGVTCNIKNKTHIVDTDKWTLSFNDEFTGTEIDENKWMTRYYWGNAENDEYHTQVYTSNSLRLDDGKLFIEPKIKQTKGWTHINHEYEAKDGHYTSGLIHSGDFFRQKFGLFSMRVKVPKGCTQPSFWLLNKQSWPPEIDIFEFNADGNMSIGLTWGSLINNETPNKFTKVLSTENLTHDYHIYTCEWGPNKIKWYLDNKLVAIYAGTGIPQTPMYVMVNLALTEKQPTNEMDSMSIDWIRVWKLKNI